MAITGNLTYKGLNIPTAYIEIVRVFGGPAEGYSALLNVYASATEKAAGNLLEQINPTGTIPYVAGQDPVTEMYNFLINGAPANPTATPPVAAVPGQFAGFTLV